MPNLRQSVLEHFWNAKNPRLARILGWMESMEDWILDDQEQVLEEIFELAAALEHSSPERIAEASEEISTVLAYMSSPRALRVIQWLDDAFGSEAGLALVKEAVRQQDEESTAALMLDRFQRLNQISLLSHIFAPSRSRAIYDLLSDQPAVAS